MNRRPIIGSGPSRPASPEVVLRAGVSLVRRQPIPPHGHGIVLRVGAETGAGVPQPYVEGVRFFRLAADQGDASAQFNLGVMYENGFGVPQDDTEAVRWYRLAADQGDAPAQDTLGGMYANGRGVPQDDAEAVRWYGLAADQGIAEAQYNVGVSYADGLGVPRSSYRIIAATSSSVRNSRSPYSVGRSTGVIVATS